MTKGSTIPSSGCFLISHEGLRVRNSDQALERELYITCHYYSLDAFCLNIWAGTQPPPTRHVSMVSGGEKQTIFLANQLKNNPTRKDQQIRVMGYILGPR